MLAYAWKSLGWFLAGVAVALGFLLVPLQVAAERKKLDHTTRQVAEARRDIRALETEFDTRANLAQLERWNGDTLRLTAPAAAQFVPDEAALAAVNFTRPMPGDATVQMAALVVPSRPELGAPAVSAQPVATPAVAVRVAATAMPAPTKAEAKVVTKVASIAAAPRVAAPVAPAAGRKAPARDRVAPTGKAQAVAMLDRKLLSDSTLGELLSGARAEAGAMR